MSDEQTQIHLKPSEQSTSIKPCLKNANSKLTGDDTWGNSKIKINKSFKKIENDRFFTFIFISNHNSQQQQQNQQSSNNRVLHGTAGISDSNNYSSSPTTTKVWSVPKTKSG